LPFLSRYVKTSAGIFSFAKILRAFSAFSLSVKDAACTQKRSGTLAVFAAAAFGLPVFFAAVFAGFAAAAFFAGGGRFFVSEVDSALPQNGVLLHCLPGHSLVG